MMERSWSRRGVTGAVAVAAVLATTAMSQAKALDAEAIAHSACLIKAGGKVPIFANGYLQEMERTEDPSCEARMERGEILITKGWSFRDNKKPYGVVSDAGSRLVATTFRLARNGKITPLAGYLLDDDGARVAFTFDKNGKLAFAPDTTFKLCDVHYVADADGRLDPARCGPASLSPKWHAELFTPRGSLQYRNPGTEKITLTMTAKGEWLPDAGAFVEVNGDRMKASGGRLLKAPARSSP